MALDSFMSSRSLLRGLGRGVKIFPARGEPGRWTKAIVRVEQFTRHTDQGSAYQRYEGVAKLSPDDYLGLDMLIEYNGITYAIDETKTNATENAVDLIVVYIYAEQDDVGAFKGYRVENP